MLDMQALSYGNEIHLRFFIATLQKKSYYVSGLNNLIIWNNVKSVWRWRLRRKIWRRRYGIECVGIHFGAEYILHAYSLIII